MPWLLPMLVLGLNPPGVQQEMAAPNLQGEAEDLEWLLPWLDGALRSSAAFGPWPPGPWHLHLHETDAQFEQATGAPPSRAATWIGSTLHLRPRSRLERRDVGAVLRHELTHRRLVDQGLRRWKEEAICLWAEGHTRLPAAWPPDPGEALQQRLDLSLNAGTTESQRWAYAWLRAWSLRRPLPSPPGQKVSVDWQAEPAQPQGLRVVWPPERLPRTVTVNGTSYSWKPMARVRVQGTLSFSGEMPVSRLEGSVELAAVAGGWRMTWTAGPDAWIAAATEGELGREAPFEAKRALAAVLRAWLAGHPSGNHPDHAFCPLTHCAVIRESATVEGARAAASAPDLPLSPARAFFTGSNGGVSLSPREVWGRGSPIQGAAMRVPGDPWADWERVLSAAQVRSLKASVKPGLRTGQRGLRLGRSGPYAVESLRLEAGRRFGWTLWPSNACEAEILPDGGLKLRGHGWGHNAGLCLATALFQAREGHSAEEILRDAFPPE